MIELPGLHLTLESPHGFFRRQRFLPCHQKFRVLPPLAISADTIPRVKRNNSLPQHGIHRLQRSGMGSELLELREYIPGDPPKAIAWKVSARRDKLMTRQYDSEVPVRVRLLIDGAPSTRIGSFGRRLIDQSMQIAAGIARSAISSGDPVGAVLLDNMSIRRVAFQSGERGFHKLIESLAEFSAISAPPVQSWSARLHDMTLRHMAERFPELFEFRLSQIPFTWWPMRPSRRKVFHQRYVMAGILGIHFDLSIATQIRLLNDNGLMAEFASLFLGKCGVSRLEPLSEREIDAQTNLNFGAISAAIVNCTQHARDNEVLVVLANLFQLGQGRDQLLSAIRLAVSKHHRVIVTCPSPTFRRFTATSCVPKSNTVQHLLDAGEQIRFKELAADFTRELRRVGAVVAFSGEQEAIQLVLGEMEFARTGRSNVRGARL